MRWRIDGINYASGVAVIAGHEAELCKFDNGATVCDAGHSIATVGACTSQSIGTVNSTGPQPAYPICSSDYVDMLDSFAQIYSESFTRQGTFVLPSFGGDSCGLSERVKQYYIDQEEWVIVKSLEKGDFNFDILVHTNFFLGNYTQFLDYDYINGLYLVLQRRSGFVTRGEDVTSQYFSLDVFCTFPIIMHSLFSPKFLVNEKIIVEDTLSSEWSEIKYEAPEGEEDVCVGDLTPPSLENVSPTEYSHLNSLTGNLYFDVVDSIGGVDKSSIYVTVSGNITSQPEGIDIVSAGVPIEQASLIGTDERYSLVYTPTNPWSNNEVVFVTVTGCDNVPDGPDDSPFSCLTGDPNTFGSTWYYQVLDSSDFTASINAIADDGSPYLYGESPTPFFGGIPADTDISFYIKDDLSGVDLSSVFVYINDIVVVRNGTAVGSSISISSSPGGYYFKYTSVSLFSYGSRVSVRVVADDLYSFAVNSLDYTYFFDIVGDGTLRIENFYPEVGVTWDPENIDISVDVIDEVYDVSESGLYLSINGQQVPAYTTTLYGNINLYTTFSGISTISGSVLEGVSLTNASMLGVSVVGSSVFGGSLYSGYFNGVGSFGGLEYPFCTSLSGVPVYGGVSSGALASGVLNTTLVSGVNWDGSYVSSTITNVELVEVYSSAVTSSGTVISGSVGRRLGYHPDNDFNYSGVISVLVHGENASCAAPVTVEKVYQLFHGYNVKVYDREFNHSSRVNVFVGALNTESFTNELSYGYYFTTIDQPYNDVNASITGIAPWVELGADINPQAPVHRYGETVEVEVYVEDVEGNALGPYTFTYTIEEAPE